MEQILLCKVHQGVGGLGIGLTFDDDIWSTMIDDYTKLKIDMDYNVI